MLRLSSHMDSVEHHLGLSIEKNNRDIDRLKVDLSDMLEQKSAQMQNSFNVELADIKSKYE